MRIAVVGSGYVGLVAAVCLSEIGNEVICVDNDPDKLKALRSGELPIHEKHLAALLARQAGGRLVFSGDLAEATRASSVVFIAVGTPALPETGEADLSYVEAVARDIASAIEDEYKLIVCKSTVPVYTTAWVRRSMLLKGAPPASFDVAANPEFLREGNAVTDFLYPDRIVIGSDSDRAATLLQAIYEPLTSGRYYENEPSVPEPRCGVRPSLILTSTKSAELIKHASNAFLAMKISFINAVAVICEAVQADIVEVCNGIGSDRRIGHGFLNPGLGYGGSCFPKDIAAFRTVARDAGYEFSLLDEVARINEEQKVRFVQKIRSALWTLRGKRIAALGLSFKGGTDDLRESPALAIIRILRKEKAEIVAYDPAAMIRAQRELEPDLMTLAANPYEAASNADALLILTDWDEFARLDLPRLRQQLRYPILIDGRNLYNPQVLAAEGFTYISVGRPEAGSAELTPQRGIQSRLSTNRLNGSIEKAFGAANRG